MSKAQYEVRRAKSGDALLCTRAGAELPSDMKEMDWGLPRPMIAAPPHIAQAIDTAGYYLTGSEAAEASWDEAMRQRQSRGPSLVEHKLPTSLQAEPTAVGEPPHRADAFPELGLETFSDAPPAPKAEDLPGTEAAPPADTDFDESASLFKRMWQRRRS